MSDEATEQLQGVDIEEGSPIEGVPEPIEGQSPDEGSELAPDSGENREQKSDGEGEEKSEEGSQEQQPDSVQAAINKQHKKFRDEERAHQETRRRLEELEAQVKLQDNSEPVIPPMPDPYEDGFEEKVKERDAALVRHAQWSQQQQYLQQQQADQEQQAQYEAVQRRAESGKVYAENATKLGVDGSDLQLAAQAVAQYGISDDLLQMVLDDPEGPLMTQYLASNLMELGKLNQMPTAQAVLHMNSFVRAEASKMKPRGSGAPTPPEILDGGGVPEKDDVLDGVTIE